MATKAVAARTQQSRRPADVAGGAVRTCVGCRKVGDRGKLVRLVRTTTASGDTEVAVDLRRRLPGRGAWLHSDPECWKKALKRRAIGRALPGVTTVAAAESFAANELAFMAEPEART